MRDRGCSTTRTKSWSKAYHFALIALLIFVTHAAHAESAFQYYSITMLQTQQVFEERVSRIEIVSSYLKEIVGSVTEVVNALPKGEPAKGFIVVALKPGHRSRIWLDFESPITEEVASGIQRASEKVSPPSVTGGVVLLAMKVGLWGSGPPDRMVPQPEAWRAEAEKAGGKIEMTELVERVWRE